MKAKSKKTSSYVENPSDALEAIGGIRIIGYLENPSDALEAIGRIRVIGGIQFIVCWQPIIY